MRIVFMGTPDFAVESLKALVEANENVVAVITAPDKPSGRGQKIHQSAVKQYALTQNIPVLQPEKLKNSTFLEELRSYKADLQIVVAFRMLPEVIWNMPPLGTVNVHASLLPNTGVQPRSTMQLSMESEKVASPHFYCNMRSTRETYYCHGKSRSLKQTMPAHCTISLCKPEQTYS
jgi:methionyl-tRNA formyltransferase